MVGTRGRAWERGGAGGRTSMNFLPPLRGPSSVVSSSVSKKEAVGLYAIGFCVFGFTASLSNISSALTKSKSPAGSVETLVPTLLTPRLIMCAPVPGWLRLAPRGGPAPLPPPCGPAPLPAPLPPAPLPGGGAAACTAAGAAAGACRACEGLAPHAAGFGGGGPRGAAGAGAGAGARAGAGAGAGAGAATGSSSFVSHTCRSLISSPRKMM